MYIYHLHIHSPRRTYNEKVKCKILYWAKQDEIEKWQPWLKLVDLIWGHLCKSLNISIQVLTGKLPPLFFGFCILKHLRPLVWMIFLSCSKIHSVTRGQLCHAGCLSLGIQGGHILLEHEWQSMPQCWRISCPVNLPSLPLLPSLQYTLPGSSLPSEQSNLEIPGEKTCVTETERKVAG